MHRLDESNFKFKRRCFTIAAKEIENGNCEDLASRMESQASGVRCRITSLWEESINFISNCWNLTQASPLLKYLSHRNMRIITPWLNQIINLKLRNYGSSHTEKPTKPNRAQMLNEVISQYSSNWETGNDIYIIFYLNHLIFALNSLLSETFWSLSSSWKFIQLGNQSFFFLWLIHWWKQLAYYSL